MSQIGVNFSSLAGTQAQIAASVNKMNQQLSDLRSYLQPMVATWTGQASENYQQLQQKWDQSAADLNMVLQQVAQATDAANQDFQQTEKANASRFAG